MDKIATQHRAGFRASAIWLVIFLIASPGLSFRSANAQSAESLDGTWEATMTMIQGPGLGARIHPPQVWRLTVVGDMARMFIRRDNGQFSEVKPGVFKMARHQNNVLVYSLDSASDGSWIETEAWLFVRKSPDILGATFSGAVNNPRTRDPDLKVFFTVRSGNFRRLP